MLSDIAYMILMIHCTWGKPAMTDDTRDYDGVLGDGSIESSLFKDNAFHSETLMN